MPCIAAGPWHVARPRPQGPRRPRVPDTAALATLMSSPGPPCGPQSCVQRMARRRRRCRVTADARPAGAAARGPPPPASAAAAPPVPPMAASNGPRSHPVGGSRALLDVKGAPPTTAPNCACLKLLQLEAASSCSKLLQPLCIRAAQAQPSAARGTQDGPPLRSAPSRAKPRRGVSPCPRQPSGCLALRFAGTWLYDLTAEPRYTSAGGSRPHAARTNRRAGTARQPWLRSACQRTLTCCRATLVLLQGAAPPCRALQERRFYGSARGGRT